MPNGSCITRVSPALQSLNMRKLQQHRHTRATPVLTTPLIYAGMIRYDTCLTKALKFCPALLFLWDSPGGVSIRPLLRQHLAGWKVIQRGVQQLPWGGSYRSLPLLATHLLANTTNNVAWFLQLLPCPVLPLLSLSPSLLPSPSLTLSQPQPHLLAPSGLGLEIRL